MTLCLKGQRLSWIRRSAAFLSMGFVCSIAWLLCAVDQAAAGQGDRNKPVVSCLTKWAQTGSSEMHVRFRPSHCDFHSPDGLYPIGRHSVIPTRGLHWKRWGRKIATGRGKLHITTAGFKKTKVWLTRPRYVCGSWSFTRIQFHVAILGKGRKVAIDACPQG